jgi:EmrB/QacA subfamily drug resistance transporter
VTASATATPGGPSNVTLRHSPWLALITLCLGFFMILLDTTIVNIAIPNMIDKLGASLDEILWVINAYILIFAVLLIPAGRLGDLYGPKRLFIIGLIIFTLASAACGLAQTPGQLIAFRVIQGIGGALLTPQTLSTITMIFPPEKRGAAFGIWGSVAGLATIAGPTLGGWLVTNWDWRWIFFVNVPVGIATLILAVVVLPDIQLHRRHQLDWVGTTLATLGLFLVCFGLIEGEHYDWGTVAGPITIPLIIASGILVLAVMLWQQYLERDGEPLIPFTIFADRNYSLMNAVVAAIAFGMFGLFLPLTIFLQSVLGLSALQAGLTFAPMSLVSTFVAPFAGRFADKVGGKWILFAGLLLWTIGMWTLVEFTTVDSTRWSLLPSLLIAGVGLGLTFAPLQTIAMLNIKPQVAGAASGFINTTRQLGAVIGSAAVGALLQAQLATQLPASAKDNAAALPAQFRDQFVEGFSNAASNGLQVGAGQTGVQLPPGIPEQAKPTILEAATKTFHEGYVTAMHYTLLLPLCVLAVAVLLVLFVRRQPGSADGAEPASAAAESASQAA